MNLWKRLEPRGGKPRQFLTWLAYGVIGGTFAGILVGIIWVSVEWINPIRSGNRPTWSWVRVTYEMGAILFGLGGAAFGAIVGSAMGISEILESKVKDTSL